MRPEARAVQRNLLKLLLTAAAMMVLYTLLWPVGDPICSWCESAGIGSAIGGVGWIVYEAIRVMAILIVSLLSGVIFPRDRWIARLAALIWLLLLLLKTTFMLQALSNDAQGDLVSFITESLMMPLLSVTVIALIFSAFFHDCGRVLRGYFQNREYR
ncbi:MAG: hypothetical protein ACYSWO_03390 [Planctomycetota bacterium]|jgi:hypothetical protein